MVKFFICNHCGNIIEMVRDRGVKVECCGEPMQLLVPGTSDGAKEKHVPFVEVADEKLAAKIGEVPHPMEEKHYIEWIAFVNEDIVKRVNLKPGEEAIAYHNKNFKGEVYEYCNLHGLWKTEVK